MPTSQDRVQLGLQCQQRGELALALAHYQAVLARHPDHADALHLSGLIALQRNQLLPGLALIDHALQHNPGLASAHLNRGNALLSLQRYGDALSSFDRAVALQPHAPDAWCNRSAALQSLGRPQEALHSALQALLIDPLHVNALNNQGNALRTLGRLDEAIASYCMALQAAPDNPQTLNNCGVALQDLHQLEDALLCYERALQANPGFVAALGNRAECLQSLKRHEEAIACFTALLALQPDWDYALGKKLHAQLQICAWDDHAAAVDQVTQAVLAGRRADTPSYFLAVSDSAAAQLQCARTYIADKHPASAEPLYRGERYAHNRIRLAYLSADFHDHATAYLMAELFELHERTRFELTAVSFGPAQRSPMRERLEHAFDAFLDVRQLSDGAVARLLREREIDIAVDLKGFTQGSRTAILAHRPAPVQCSFLGYPGTMGAPYIDYLIADQHVIPEGCEVDYRESVVRLPASYQCNDRQRQISSRLPARAELGLPPRGFVYCCFNNNYKITPVLFDIWMRLLQATPASVLWLLQDNPQASGNLQRHAQARGVDPNRLVFAKRLALPEHLARHHAADLFLDTLPVNAHTTASDALWAGLPVLTCTGNAFAGRVAASLLQAMHLPELVTHNLRDYETQALALATHPAQLAGLRVRLAQQRQHAPLFDTLAFRCKLESAYATMMQRHTLGLAPAGFRVADGAAAARQHGTIG